MQPRAIVLAVLGATACLVSACESEVVPAGEGGAGGGGGARPVGPSSTSTASASASTSGMSSTSGSTSTSGPAPVSASSGPGCDHELFASNDLNACGDASCCAQMDDCANDAASCTVDDDTIDTSLPLGAALHECMFLAGCFGANVCDSGLVLEGDDQETREYALCLGELCCEAFVDCTFGGTDVESCKTCLEVGPPYDERCEAAAQCSRNNCESGGFLDICDSGIGSNDPALLACLDEYCCEAYEACADGGDTAQPCLDCLIDGGGPLCDAAIACEAEYCDTFICDTGIQTGSVDFAQCLSESCCEAFTVCTGGDAGEQAISACVDCYNEAIESGVPGALCEDAFACAIEACDGPI